MKKTITLSVVGLLCWVVMFLAGTDVWHFAGSPDFWSLSGPPYTDLKAFGYAFYLQFFVLIALSGIALRATLGQSRRDAPGS